MVRSWGSWCIGLVLVGLVALPIATRAAGQAQVVVIDDTVILGPTGDGGGIMVNTTARIVFTPSPRMQTPQRGTWNLEWQGSATLPAGHYEGRWAGNAYVQSFTFDESGVPHLVVPAHLTFVMPGHGTVTWHAVNYQTGVCLPGMAGSYTQEWHFSQIRGTGVFSGLTDVSGDAVAVVVKECVM